MRLLIGCSSPPDRGSGILSYTQELCEALLSFGAELHLASPAPNDWSWVHAHGINHLATSQADKPIDGARQIIEYIKEKRIDGVINNDNALLQSVSPAVPCSFISIGHLSQGSIAALACFRHEWTDYVVAICSEMQQVFVKRYGVPITKCPIVYNGVADRGLGGAAENHFNHKLKAVFTGGYNIRHKGADHLLKAVLNGGDAWEGIDLEWFGDLPGFVQRKIGSLPFVHMHGRVARQELLRALMGADVLVLPSKVEGCPMTMLEAMSLGVVPIVSDGIGAMKSMIQSGQEGYVCHLSKWPEQLLNCLQHLRDNPGMLGKMKEAARTRYLSDYQSIRVAESLLTLLRHPTVDRSHPVAELPVLRWHRPFRPDGLKAPLIDRLCIRFGILRRGGVLRMATTADYSGTIAHE